jgi:hypothetical protein
LNPVTSPRSGKASRDRLLPAYRDQASLFLQQTPSTENELDGFGALYFELARNGRT